MKILIDLDSTLADTSKAYFDYYRECTGDFSTEYSEDKISWNMITLCKLWSSQEQADKVYIQEGFFKHLKLYPNVTEILNRLKEAGHCIHIVSCHHLRGAEYKRQWIKDNLPMIDEVTIIPIESGLQKFDKSSVQGAILIDDKEDALDSANVKYKILYGNYPWNDACNKYKRVLNWNELYEYIQEIEKYPNGIDVDKLRAYYKHNLYGDDL